MTTLALLRVLEEVGERLDEAGLAWALVGGLAVSARTVPRFTHDADIALGVADDHMAEQFVHRMVQEGYQTGMGLDHEATGRLATVRLIHRSQQGDAVVDLLFASSGIEAEIAAAADRLNLTRDLVVPIATVAHLIALKILARDDDKRPQDLMDLRSLLRDATDDDVIRAREALELIETRGYGRGRDLCGMLDQAVTRFRLSK